MSSSRFTALWFPQLEGLSGFGTSGYRGLMHHLGNPRNMPSGVRARVSPQLKRARARVLPAVEAVAFWKSWHASSVAGGRAALAPALLGRRRAMSPRPHLACAATGDARRSIGGRDVSGISWLRRALEVEPDFPSGPALDFTRARRGRPMGGGGGVTSDAP